MLPLRDVEVDRAEEAVGGVVEGPPECRSGSMDEDLAQLRGHALGAESASRDGHLGRIAAAPDPEYAGGAMAAYAVIARIGRADPHLTVRDLDDDLDRDPPDQGGTQLDAPSIVEAPREPSIGERLAEQVFWVREAFGQATFYLFDPESWRR